MRPIVFIDVETTGTDVTVDRIVQLAAIKTINGINEIIDEKKITINPGCPIPSAASEIHGITDDDVKDKPSFAQYAKAVFDFFYNCDYAGFNIRLFDIPILSEEFSRCGLAWPDPDAQILDAFHVFREKEKRDLASAFKFYCNEDLQGAHDAFEDIKATRLVMIAQCSKYDDLCTIEQFLSFCKIPNALDLAGKIVLNDQGEAVYNFGKDKGKVIKQNPGFGKWMLGQNFPSNTKNILKTILQDN